MVSQMTQEPIIQIRNLVNCFGKQCVHQDLNLDVQRGEVLGVVGDRVRVSQCYCAVSWDYVALRLGRFMCLVRI